MTRFFKIKRMLCLAMALILLFPILGQPAYASQLYDTSTEALFMTYPQYLSNEKMNQGTGACESACYAVLNSYNNKGNSFWAAFITSLNGGLKLTFQDFLSKLGITKSYADENLSTITNTFLSNYLNLGTELPDTADRVKKATEKLQKSYKAIKNTQAEIKISAMAEPLQEFGKSLGLKFSSKQIEDFIKGANESQELRDLCSEVSDGIDDALLISNVAIGLFQVYCFDLAVIQDLMAELKRCDIQSSDLYRGLEMIYEKKTNGPIWDALQDYLIPEAISNIAHSAETLLYGVTGASGALIALTQITIRGIANVLYTDAKADDLIQATYAVSFADALELCIHHYRTKFLSRTGTADDITRYELLYRAWLSADDTALDLCYDICKKKDLKELGTNCVNAQRALRGTYTYENYLQWCKDQLPDNPPVPPDQEPVLTISGQTAPTNLSKGSNFGLRGIIKTDCGVITTVYGEITDLSGNIIQSGQHYPNKASDNLQYSINNDLIFGQLDTGNYIYRARATARNGSEETTQTLIECQFQVQGTSSSAASAAGPNRAAQKPVISLSGETLPTSLPQGSNFGIRGTVSASCSTITDLRGSLLDGTGNEIQSGQYYPDTPSVDLRYSINNDLIFEYLTPGQYTYRVRATAQNGSEQTTEDLINQHFQIVGEEQTQPAVSQTEEPTRAPVLSISGQNLPENHQKGKNFGIRGTVTTDCGVITGLYGAILDSAGNAVCSGWYSPYSASVDLRYTINDDLIFDTLGAGTYTYYVQASAENNGQRTEQVLIQHMFSVEVEAGSQQAEPALNTVARNMTVDVGAGSTLRFCSTVSTGNQYELGSIPNGTVVYVYGTTQQQYENRIWAKISYNGADGWVNYKWLS